MPPIVPSAVPLVVASPPALVAPGVPSVLPAPYVLRHPALSARALEELAEGVRREHRDWDPRPWWRRPTWPDPPPLLDLDSNQKVFLDQGDDFSDLRGRPGLNFVVIGQVSNKTIQLTGTGSLAQPIVLRGASDDDATANGVVGTNYTVLSGCSGPVFTANSTRCILYRFRAEGCHFAVTGGQQVRVARVAASGNAASGGSPFAVNAVNGLRIDRCWYGTRAGGTTSGAGVEPSSSGTVNHEVCYCHFSGVSPPTSATGASIMCVTYPNHGQTPLNYGPGGFPLWLHHTLTTGAAGAQFNLVETKATDPVVSDNTVRYDIAGGVGVNIRARHGLRPIFLRNLFVYDGGGRGGGDIQMRDVDGQIGENASLNSSDWSVNGGSQATMWAGNLDGDRWLTDRTPGGGTNYESCKRALCGGNAMPVVCGQPSPTSSTNPNTYPADHCVIPPDARADGNASVSFGNASNTDRTTNLSFRLASARAMRPLTATSVGVALP